MKHLIIEGMDGSGKDTLIADLMEFPFGQQFTLHDRASTSLGGPVDALAQWVENDLAFIHTGPRYIYNRHPLISEPIYGPHREGRPTAPNFGFWPWLEPMSMLMAKHSVVVVCHPPFSVVQETLERQGKDAHMPGVYENAKALWQSYEKFIWPGRVVRYNYRRDTVQDLIRTLAGLGI